MSIGRCNILISATGLLVFLMWAIPSFATPTAVELTVETIEGGWTDIVLEEAERLPLDVQIFTEISPIVGTEDGVRLPEDQEE